MQYAVELYYDEETQNKDFCISKMITKKISTKFLSGKHDHTLLWRVFMMWMNVYVSKN